MVEHVRVVVVPVGHGLAGASGQQAVEVVVPSDAHARRVVLERTQPLAERQRRVRAGLLEVPEHAERASRGADIGGETMGRYTLEDADVAPFGVVAFGVHPEFERARRGKPLEFAHPFGESRRSAEPGPDVLDRGFEDPVEDNVNTVVFANESTSRLWHHLHLPLAFRVTTSLRKVQGESWEPSKNPGLRIRNSTSARRGVRR